MYKILIPIIFLLGSCNGIKKWQIDYPDNMIEEMVEKAIEKKFGYDVDLTPITGPETQKLNDDKE